MTLITLMPSDSIQKALDSLDPAKKSVLRLMPGVYEEEQLVYPPDINVTIEGTGVADLDFTVIWGKHILSENSCVAYNHIKFESDESTFESNPGNNITFLFRSCVIQIHHGYPLNLPKVKGNGIFFDCCVFGEENGLLNNEEGGLNMRFYNMTSKSDNEDCTLIVNHSSLFFNVHINHKIRLLGNSKYDFQGGSWIEGEIAMESITQLNIGATQVDKPIQTLLCSKT